MRSFNRVLRVLLLVVTACITQTAMAAVTELDHVVAVVNDDVILNSELEQRVSTVKQQFTGQDSAPPANVLRNQVLQQLVLEKIELQMAKTQGIRVSDAQLNQAIASIAQRNNLSVEQFRQNIINEGSSWADARQQIRNQIIIGQVQRANVNRRITITDQEVKNYLNSQQGANQVRYQLRNILIALPANPTREQREAAQEKARKLVQKVRNGADFSELAIANSDASNALKGGELGWRQSNELPESIAAAIANLKPGEVSQPISSNSGFNIMYVEDREGDVQKMQKQTKVRHILITTNEIRDKDQAKALIEKLYSQIKNGASFADLARQYSDDSGSGSQGGELGWATPGEMVPAFEKVMNKTPINGLSQPFQTRYGWHILQVEDRRSINIANQMNERRARAAIRQRKFNEELDIWLRETRAGAYVEIKE